MKKTLVILLALVLVFAFASSAMAEDTQYEPFGDVSNLPAEVQTAIEKLAIYGALKGYDEAGTIFGGDRNITREEYATILVRVAGLEDQVPLYAAMVSSFGDVESDRWSKGYINCAAANNIMIGRGVINGIKTFDPKANVTMQEVATGALRAAGYTDALPGNWPNNYNNKAVAVGLAQYVDFVGPKAATRAEVASIVNEATELSLVYYLDNEIAKALGQSMGFLSNYYDNNNNSRVGTDSDLNYVDKDGFAYKSFSTNAKKAYRSTLAFEGYGAYTTDYVLFQDSFTDGYYDEDDDEWISFDFSAFSESTGWGFTKFTDWELEAYLMSYADIASPAESSYWDWTIEFASLYGISNGCDITDLGGQIAKITIIDEEIVYIELVSSIDRTVEADKDYEENNNYILGKYALAEEDYGEIYSVNKALTLKLIDSNGDVWVSKKYKANDVYWAKDFAVFEAAPFGIVDDADEKNVNFKSVDSNYYNGFTSRINLTDKQDEAFYLMGEGFVKGSDLKAGDVVYKDNFWEKDDIYEDDMDGLGSQQDKVDFYLVFRPVSGSFDSSSSKSVEIDGVDYGVQIDGDGSNSFYSADQGDTFSRYNWSVVKTINWSDGISWVPAYAFTKFAYFSDDMAIYNYGILDHYEFPSGSNTTWSGGNATKVLGVYIQLPGDKAGDPTYIKFDSNVSKGDTTNYPVEGSLVEFVLNKDGTFASFRGANSLKDATGLMAHIFKIGCTGAANGVDYGAQSDCTQKNDRLNIDGDVYTFSDSAKIFLVESEDGNGAVYDWYSAECITPSDFKEMGDFSAKDICVYKSSSNKIQVLYICDIDADGDGASYLFGVFSGKTGTKGSNNQAEINGVMVNVHKDVIGDFENANAPCLVAYKLSGSEIKDGNFLLIEYDDGDDGDPTTPHYYMLDNLDAFNTDFKNAHKDKYDLIADFGEISGYTGGSTIKFVSDDKMSDNGFNGTLYMNDFNSKNGFNGDTGKELKLSDLDKSGVSASALIAYDKKTGDLLYMIVWDIL